MQADRQRNVKTFSKDTTQLYVSDAMSHRPLQQVPRHWTMTQLTQRFDHKNTCQGPGPGDVSVRDQQIQP
jgi:hypothetical protein